MHNAAIEAEDFPFSLGQPMSLVLECTSQRTLSVFDLRTGFLILKGQLNASPSASVRLSRRTSSLASQWTTHDCWAGCSSYLHRGPRLRSCTQYIQRTPHPFVVVVVIMRRVARSLVQRVDGAAPRATSRTVRRLVQLQGRARPLATTAYPESG
ncbi:hypothetical protein B0H12DRAFT_1147094 [Mycena haematopus]|nr:hypothetical protein B0H12DRAFT_1147094 [Mycena haematopus]